MAKLLEVTVPVEVQVQLSKDGSVKAWKIVGAAVPRGYPGFFSDAEEAGGVWIPEESEWDTPGDYWKVSLSAKDWVRARIERT